MIDEVDPPLTIDYGDAICTYSDFADGWIRYREEFDSDPAQLIVTDGVFADMRKDSAIRDALVTPEMVYKQPWISLDECRNRVQELRDELPDSARGILFGMTVHIDNELLDDYEMLFIDPDYPPSDRSALVHV